MDLFNQTDNGAIFSKNRKYRYVLWRIWDKNKPIVMFIGINPSKADEQKPDPTITRVVKFAFDWGFGGVYMLNLFTYVTQYPDVLKRCDDPVGPADHFILEYSKKVNKIICAWGNFNEAKQRASEVIQLLHSHSCHALIINKDGSPSHPLYVHSNVKPIQFK